MHTETVLDSFFGSGEQEWCDDGWLGDDDYDSVAGPRTAYGLWQETDEDDATRYDANWEEDFWIGIEELPEELAHNATPAFLGGQLLENETTIQMLCSHCSNLWWRPMRRKTRVDGRGHMRGVRWMKFIEIEDTIQRMLTAHSLVMASAKARLKNSSVAQAQEGHRQRTKQGQETEQVNIRETRSHLGKGQGQPSYWTFLLALSRTTPYARVCKTSHSILWRSSMDKVIARSLTRSCSVKATRRRTHVHSYVAIPLVFGFSAAALQGRLFWTVV